MSCGICVATAPEDSPTQTWVGNSQTPPAEVNQDVGFTRDATAKLVEQEATENTKERARLELATFLTSTDDEGTEERNDEDTNMDDGRDKDDEKNMRKKERNEEDTNLRGTMKDKEKKERNDEDTNMDDGRDEDDEKNKGKNERNDEDTNIRAKKKIR